jgi:hypothetical protein
MNGAIIIEITDRFVPGALGTIVTLHGQHYAKHWEFEAFFEVKVVWPQTIWSCLPVILTGSRPF